MAKPNRTAVPADIEITRASPKEQAPEDQAPEEQAPEEQAPEDQAPEDQAPEDQAPDGQTKVVTTCRLLEPHLFIRFAAGVPTVVPEITNWMKAQIDAGLMEEV
jgi:hypothetical protein